MANLWLTCFRGGPAVIIPSFRSLFIHLVRLQPITYYSCPNLTPSPTQSQQGTRPPRNVKAHRKYRCIEGQPGPKFRPGGEMAEWFKAHAWKA